MKLISLRQCQLQSSMCFSVSVSSRWTAQCSTAGRWFRVWHLGSPSCSGWIWSLWWWWASLSMKRWGPRSRSLGLHAPEGWWSGASSWPRLCSSTRPLSYHSSPQSPSSCCMKPHPEAGEGWDTPRHCVSLPTWQKCQRLLSYTNFEETHYIFVLSSCGQRCDSPWLSGQWLSARWRMASSISPSLAVDVQPYCVVLTHS